jgi:hypothetical protein
VRRKKTPPKRGFGSHPFHSCVVDLVITLGTYTHDQDDFGTVNAVNNPYIARPNPAVSGQWPSQSLADLVGLPLGNTLTYDLQGSLGFSTTQQLEVCICQ